MPEKANAFVFCGAVTAATIEQLSPPNDWPWWNPPGIGLYVEAVVYIGDTLTSDQAASANQWLEDGRLRAGRYGSWQDLVDALA